jgi:hypothetical protein
MLCFGLLAGRLGVVGYTPRGPIRRGFSMRTVNDREHTRMVVYLAKVPFRATVAIAIRGSRGACSLGLPRLGLRDEARETSLLIDGCRTRRWGLPTPRMNSRPNRLANSLRRSLCQAHRLLPAALWPPLQLRCFAFTASRHSGNLRGALPHRFQLQFFQAERLRACKTPAPTTFGRLKLASPSS